MLERHHVYVARVQVVSRAPVRFQVLLLDLATNHVRISIAACDVIDRHCKALAFGMTRGYRSQQIGRKGGNAAFARQVIAEKCDCMAVRPSGWRRKTSHPKPAANTVCCWAAPRPKGWPPNCFRTRSSAGWAWRFRDNLSRRACCW